MRKHTTGICSGTSGGKIKVLKNMCFIKMYAKYAITITFVPFISIYIVFTGSFFIFTSRVRLDSESGSDSIRQKILTPTLVPTPVVKKKLTPVQTPTPINKKMESTSGLTPTPGGGAPGIYTVRSVRQKFRKKHFVHMFL